MFLFSLQAPEAFLENSQIFMVGLFYEKVKSQRLLTIFPKKLQRRLSVGFYTAFGNIFKKNSDLKRFPQLCKTFCVIILIFSHEWENRVTERNKRLSLTLTFINQETQPVYDFCWSNHWKWLVPDPMHGSWVFCQTVGVGIVFHSLTSCSNSVK